MLANVSYPPLSKYMRTKVILHMTASRIWISEHHVQVKPCELCPPTRRLSTRTTISFSYRIGPKEQYRVCYKCVARLQLRRENEQQWAELRLYQPIRAQRLKRGR